MSNIYISPRSFKTCLLGAGIFLLGIFLPTPLSNSLVNAVELGEGKTFFERSPRLIDSATSFRNPFAISNYYFTIQVPEDAGEPLKSVTIVQRPNLERLNLFPDKTRAFFGENPDDDNLINILATNNEESEWSQIRIVFEQPVAPGNTVTVAVKGRNPQYGGIYQFGVTAFSEGENSPGLYLGSGRIQFSQPGSIR